MLLPSHLSPGDTIGIVSPSWGGAGLFPHRLEAGVRQLQALGYQVKLAPHALNHLSFVSDTTENRAADINQMFADPAVNAIITAIGGDHACHLLPWLDYDVIGSHPKIFMGFSDTTVLNIALWSKSGLVTFNGPALLTDFAEYPHMFSYTQEYFLKTVSNALPVGTILPAKAWTEERLDWSIQKDLERPRQVLPSGGWTCLKRGRAVGRLVGGCIESLQHLRGTPYWPDWNEAILFFETSEEKPSPETVDGILMDYENMGIFEKLNGMLVGRPMYYSEQEKHSLDEHILERTKDFSFPIITEMDFGHTAPQFTLPIGCLAGIDSFEQHFEIIEPAVT
jgi:muramoyltetrapeptide carboxypeptidase LdcA involved in peptidoglycan recycling